MWEKFYADYKKDDGKAVRSIAYGKYEYYKAYYFVMKNGCLGNIPILETQVAFIRNLLPVIALYIIALCGCCKLRDLLSIDAGCLAVLLFVAGVLLASLMFNFQDRIYYLIWEGNQYQKESEEK
jgi:hypothetical protein